LTLKVKFDKNITESDIKLFLNDTEFIPADHGDQATVQLTKDEFILQIKNVKAGRDNGTYKLKSKTSQTECEVKVQSKPVTFISELQHCRLKVLPDVLYTKSPELIGQYPREATFECSLSGTCTDVQWFINDTLIDDKIVS